MGLITSLVAPDRQAISDSEMQGPMAWLMDVSEGGRQSAAGVKVTQDTLLTLSAVFACVRAIAEDTAKLPLKLYQQQEPRGKKSLRNDPLSRLVKLAPNPEMNAFDFRCAMMACAVLWHGGFAEIERNNFGQPVALWPIHPRRVTVTRDDKDRLIYEVSNGSGSKTIFSPADMLHIKGFSDNGLVGMMMSAVARESMGVYKAAENFTASFFRNGAVPSGVIENDGVMDPQQKTTFEEKFKQKNEGWGRYFKTLVLPKGMTYKAVTSDPEKSQLLATIQFRVEDVARWFRVPPHVIGHLLHATFSNIEHQGLEYLTNCLDPWLTKVEQEYDRKLLDVTRATDFFEHVRDKILMSDTKSRYEAYKMGIESGFMTRNEVRDKENMNPFEGGDRYLVQQNLAMVDEDGNIIPVNKANEAPAPGNTPGNAPGNALGDPADNKAAAIEQAKLAAMPVLVDAAGRMIAREANAIRGKKGQGIDEAWALVFYDGHTKACASAYEPGIASLLFALGQTAHTAEACALKVAQAHVSQSKMSLLASQDIEATLNHWQTNRPVAMAQAILKEVFHDHKDHKAEN